MPSGLDTEVPQWLQQASSWYSSDQRLHENAQFMVHMQQARLQTQSQQEDLKNKIVTNQHLEKDLTDIPQWMRDHPTWQSRQDAQWPTALTPHGDRMLQEQRLRDSQSIQAEVATIATHSFASRVAELNKVDPESAGQFYPYISQRPSPDILRALSVAEQAAKLHQENVLEEKRLEAESAGATVKEVTGPRGTTQTITPAKPETENSNVKAVEQTLSDGTKIVVNPKSGAFKWMDKQGSEIQPNFAQLRMLAKDLENSRTNESAMIYDVILKRATNSLAGTAVKQTGTSSPQPAPTPTQSQPSKVLKYNPATGRIE